MTPIAGGWAGSHYAFQKTLIINQNKNKIKNKILVTPIYIYMTKRHNIHINGLLVIYIYMLCVLHNQVLLQVYEFSFGNGMFFSVVFYKFHPAHACKLLIFLTFSDFSIPIMNPSIYKEIFLLAMFVTFIIFFHVLLPTLEELA